MNSAYEHGRQPANELKPYAAYQDSGVAWLRKLPTHWTLRRLRTVAEMRVSNVDKRSRDGEEPIRLCNYIDVYRTDRIRREMSLMNATAGSDEIDRFCLCPGDVLITKDSEAWDDIGVPAFVEGAADNTVCGYHLALLRPFSGCVIGEYLFRTVQSSVVAYQFHVRANGVTRYGLTHNAIKSTWLPLPPLPEQAAIVQFLNYAERRIRRYIRAKEKLITLLEREKKALIQETVTGQLDVRTGRPYPTYKDSGVEWLGAVPAHWNVRRSKRVFRPRTELARPDDIQLSATQAYGVIAQADYEEKIGRKVTKILRHLDQRRHVEVDDFVISMRSFQGGLERAWRSGCIRSSYIVLQATATELSVGYFGHLFKSAGYIAALQSTANFIRDGQDLNFENFCRVDVPFPPIEEQHQIAQAVDSGTAHIASSVERLRRQISSLREYRARLIADAVTGKVDVREAAAGLPEPDPLAAEEDTDGDSHRRTGSAASGDAKDDRPRPDGGREVKGWTGKPAQLWSYTPARSAGPGPLREQEYQYTPSSRASPEAPQSTSSPSGSQRRRRR